VPQLDLAAQYAAIGNEVRAAIEKVLASQQFVLAPKVPRWEQEIASLCGVAHVWELVPDGRSGIGLASLRCASW